MELEKLMYNPYAWAILAICTIAAFLFAIYSWFANKKKKEFSCFYNTLKIVIAGKNIVPQLTLLYKGNDIDDLTITKYAIWNSGNEILNWSDIVTNSYLKIVSNQNTKILDAKIIVQTDKTNMFQIVDKDDSCINVSFDYAEVNDGIIIQILHTGDANNINVKCRIKGGKKLKNLNSDIKRKNKNKNASYKRDKILALILLGILIVLLIITCTSIVLAEFGIISQETLNIILFFDSSYKITYFILPIPILILILILYISMLKKFLYIGMPTKLKRYIDYYAFYYDLEIKNQ